MISMYKLLYYRGLCGFFLTQRFVGFSVPDKPYFDEASSNVFESFIRDCRFYLEYGSGGSTVYAARHGKPFVSVDTDRWFLKSVSKKIGKLSSDQRLLHGDIGLTGPWGRPLRAGNPSARRLRKWRAYADSPWRLVGNGNLPDLVLIDGRFRVASALASGMHLQAQPDTKILVDDYIDRPHYHVLEKYLKLTDMHGRMAVFHPVSQDNRKLIDAIDLYSKDWR